MYARHCLCQHAAAALRQRRAVVGSTGADEQWRRAEVQEALQPLKHDEVTELQADVARSSTAVTNKYKEVKRLIAQLHSAGA